MPGQPVSERRGEWEIPAVRQANALFLTSHLATERHGGSVQVVSSTNGELNVEEPAGAPSNVQLAARTEVEVVEEANSELKAAIEVEVREMLMFSGNHN
ncbi:Casein kinase I isoform gamma-1, partial [Ophiophagus hannah]